MGRPKKEGAEYFPHLTSNGKTIFTLESMYGNDGYAFWFKLLEILCSTEGHYFCTRKPPEWLFLVSKTRVSEETATAILKTLADLEAIDPELWAEGVIWCGKLVDNLRPVYAKRKTETPPRPVFLVQKVQQNGVSGAESTQRKEKESREKDTPPTPRKREGNFTPPDFEEVKTYCLERKNSVDPERFVDFYACKGWMVGKNKMKDWRAAVRNWEKDKKENKQSQPDPPKFQRHKCTDCKLFPLAECPEETRKRNRGCPAHENAQ